MKLTRVALLLGVTEVLALSLGLSRAESPQVAYTADQPVLLVGALKYLARQAGYELEVPLAAPFLQRVPVQVSGNFVQVVEELLEKYAPGYRLEGAPPNFRVVKAPARSASPLAPQEERKEADTREGEPQGKEVATPPPPSDGQSAQKGAKYLVIGADGSVLEGEMPKLAVAMVVDGVLTVKDGQVDLVLTPLGPACLYKGGEKVCLRALTPGLEGEIPIRLGGQTYTVRYRVMADAVVLYRYSLEGGLPAREPEVTPKPLVPPPPKPPAPPRKAPEALSQGKVGEGASSPSKKAPTPLKTLPPGSWWKEGNEVLWMGLSLAKASREGKWLSVGRFRNPENAARLFSRLKGLGLSPALVAGSQGMIAVLTPDRPETRLALKRAGLAFVPFR